MINIFFCDLNFVLLRYHRYFQRTEVYSYPNNWSTLVKFHAEVQGKIIINEKLISNLLKKFDRSDCFGKKKIKIRKFNCI